MKLSQTIDKMLTVVMLKEDLGILRCFTVPIDEVINASETRSAIVP